MLSGNKLDTRTSQRLVSFSAIAILILGFIVVMKVDADYRTERAERAVVRAQILAVSVTAAVDFSDKESTRDAVGAFRADPTARVAAVYDESGQLLGGFARQGVTLPQKLPQKKSESDAGIETFAAVERNGTHIGTVYLSSDTIPFFQRVARFAIIGAFALAAFLIILVLGIAQRSLRNANDQLGSAISDLRSEIEARNAAEAKLHQAQKMESIGQLTGGIAHDFNNMLAIIVGGIDMAVRRVNEPERVLKSLAHARAGANRAADLTTRLLAFARKQPLQPQVIEPNQLVAKMSELLRRTLGEQIIVQTVLAGGLWRICADPGQLENAILNLCVNARDAMDREGRLTIETQNVDLDHASAQQHDFTPGQYVVFVVSDNGSGMTKETIAKAFEPFFTTKDVGKGTGLGLSQVDGFVRQSGGHLEICSEVGVGTTIKIYLPIYEGTELTNQTEAVNNIIQQGSTQEIILVVEDEPDVRQISTEYLLELGYTVLQAANGTEALEMLTERKDISLLFTDVVMPGMTGHDLAIKASAINPGLAVLYTTGYTRDAIVRDGKVDHGIDLLSKPFTIEQVANKIRLALDRVTI